MSNPSNETLAEMISGLRGTIDGIKEEQLPQMRREVSNGLQQIHERLAVNSKRLDLHDSRIESIERYNAISMGAITAWKWVAGFFMALAGIFISLFSLRN